MAGENASEFLSFPSCSTPSSQMYSSSNSRPGSSRQGSGRRLLISKDAEMLSQKQLYRQPVDYVEYEATHPDTDNRPQIMMSNLSTRRHSNYSLHSSSSSSDSRPSSSSKKKLEKSSTNRPATQDIHLPRPSSWQKSSPREHFQRRQSSCLSSTANSHSEDSADESSPRQLLGKSSLSKYKPLPAIRGKTHGTSSPDILRIPTDCQTEDVAITTQNNSSLHSPKSLSMGLRRESSQLSDKCHKNQANKPLTNVCLDLKRSSPESIQDEDVRSDLKGSPTRPMQHDEKYEKSLSPLTCLPNSSPEQLGSTDLPAEPGPEEARAQLAIKLPSGERLHRFFRLTDPLWLVRRFAEVTSNNDFTNFQLVQSVPRKILDLERSIEENQVPEKILLHLEMFPQNGSLKFPNSY